MAQEIIVSDANSQEVVVENTVEQEIFVDGALRGEPGADGAGGGVNSVNTRTGAVIGLAEQTSLDTHVSNIANPHSVTKSQVGLADVPNTDFTTPVATNTAKNSYPSADATKLAGVETGAQVNTVTPTNIVTLTNKTLTSPVVNTPTGIVKGDVGLPNVDNTSDVNKPASTATLALINRFNVITYGAVGDGVTNDTTAIQSAITAMQTSGGGTLYFPSGYTYRITTGLTFSPTNLTRLCRIEAYGCTIDYTGSADAITINSNITAVSDQDAEKSFHFNGLHIKGTSSASSAVRLKATGCSFKNTVLENFTAVTSQKAAIILDALFLFWVEENHFDTLDIKNCGNGICFISRDESGGASASVMNNYFTNVHIWVKVAAGKGFYGVGLGASTVVNMSRNIFHGIVVHPFEVANVVAFDFTNCYIEGTVLTAPSVDAYGTCTNLTAFSYNYSDVLTIIGPTGFPLAEVDTYFAGGGKLNVIAGNFGGKTFLDRYIDVLDEDTMTSNSDTKVPTQQSVKAYVDASGGGSVPSDVAYDATTWDAVTSIAPSKNAVRDKIVTMDSAIALNTAKTSNATHTGDATGATALTIANNAVTNAKAAQMATKTYKGRTTAGTGNAEDVAVATLKTDLVLVKADVGLGNVDNTSDATERAAVATLTNKTLTAPKIASGDFIYDQNSNEMVRFYGGASVVNNLVIQASNTGTGISVYPEGTDTNVSMELYAKGSGTVNVNNARIVTISETQTLTNKRVTQRSNTITSSATPTPAGNDTDLFTVTALAAAATFAAPTGTPTNGQKLMIRIKDNATARTLAWNAIYVSTSNGTLPTTTTISKELYVGFIYDSTAVKWHCMGVTQVV
ncbi:MAG: glycosyl hydrolase family 28-related protein [Candidatus Saccharimonadales bacterium]